MKLRSKYSSQNQALVRIRGHAYLFVNNQSRIVRWSITLIRCGNLEMLFAQGVLYFYSIHNDIWNRVLDKIRNRNLFRIFHQVVSLQFLLMDQFHTISVLYQGCMSARFQLIYLGKVKPCLGSKTLSNSALKWLKRNNDSIPKPKTTISKPR